MTEEHKKHIEEIYESYLYGNLAWVREEIRHKTLSIILGELDALKLSDAEILTFLRRIVTW